MRNLALGPNKLRCLQDVLVNDRLTMYVCKQHTAVYIDMNIITFFICRLLMEARNVKRWVVMPSYVCQIGPKRSLER